VLDCGSGGGGNETVYNGTTILYGNGVVPASNMNASSMITSGIALGAIAFAGIIGIIFFAGRRRRYDDDEY